MTNILEAIVNISNLISLEINEVIFGSNRANNAGEGLESFIKDAFSNSFGADIKTREQNFRASFSYKGTKMRPPDLIIKNGDAIEVKKVENEKKDLQLNSSHPKQKLFAKSPFVNKYCKNCEDLPWNVKDIIYAIGHIPKGSKKLSSLWLTYGTIYAAEEEVYTSIKHTVTAILEESPKFNFSETKELGRINEVDPLNITKMRIRGMWLIQPPLKVYEYVYTYQPHLNFQLIALVPLFKYKSFPEDSRNKIENSNNKNLNIQDIEIKDPNNPFKYIPCKLITIQVQ